MGQSMLNTARSGIDPAGHSRRRAPQSMTAAQVQPHPRIAAEPIAKIAQWLELRLGTELTAFAVACTAPAVTRYADGREEPDPGVEDRLRNLYAVAWYKVTRDGPGSAYAFLTEPNAELGDRPPAELLRAGQAPESVWFAAAPPF